MIGERNAVFDRLADDGLVWLQAGVGFLRSRGFAYDDNYFQHYVDLADTRMGHLINGARLDLVNAYCRGGTLVDVGIGCGTFVESCPGAKGFDVNPAGIRWLKERGLFFDPYCEPVDAACFWDSFEHINDPAPILSNVRKSVFVAMPIFRDLAHVLSSKHFKPDEHCWYFTEQGFLRFMVMHGWECLHMNAIETELGREDIVSFAFRRGNE